MPSVGTYRDLHTPELSSHLTGHLQGNLGGHGHESLLAAQSPGDHTLAGDGTVHTQELLDAVVLVLPVAGQDHHHLNTHTHAQIPQFVHRSSPQELQREVGMSGFTFIDILHLLKPN